jgi:hypothetical protein
MLVAKVHRWLQADLAAIIKEAGISIMVISLKLKKLGDYNE